MEEQKKNITNHNVPSPNVSQPEPQPASQESVEDIALPGPQSDMGREAVSKEEENEDKGNGRDVSRDNRGESSRGTDGNSGDDDAEGEAATPDEIEAFLRARREQKDKEKAQQKEQRSLCNDPDEENAETLQAKQDSSTNPYLEADPVIPVAKYKETPFLNRGCNHCPVSYEPISEQVRHSCSKLAVKNWLEGIRQPQENPFDCVEVRFKNNRKEFFRQPVGINVVEGDVVAVEGMPGHDIGIVSLTGDLCRIQMKKKHVDPTDDSIRKLFRRAKSSDIERWAEAIHEEEQALFKTRRIVEDLGLVMKMNDVEFQGDRSKAIFYYTADERVDFRALIKVLAEAFHVRVEMKQIGVRQEASKVGGLGTCGRELCCCTWLTNFKSVTTSIAKAQQILPNPQKLAGQCGKLKCCLNFEYEVYVDALKKFPPSHTALRFKKGVALYKKTDVFRGIMWYAYEGSNDLYALKAETVKDIIEQNRNQTYPEQMEDYVVELMSTSALEQETSESEFENAIKQMADIGNEVIDNDNEGKPLENRNERRDRRDRKDNSDRRDRNVHGRKERGDNYYREGNEPRKPRGSREGRPRRDVNDNRENRDNRASRERNDNGNRRRNDRSDTGAPSGKNKDCTIAPQSSSQQNEKR